MVGSMMESELGVSAAAALASVVAPNLTHDLDAAWWSIDPGNNAESPYQFGQFRFGAGPGLSHESARVGLDFADWTPRSTD
jgi:L-alanine-DL-glutamate epimerase-like enolase superfamily enzyme